jgi:hypothetical protein
MLDLDMLRRALNRCLDECERRFGRRIDLDADHYWLIEPTAAFDLTHEPQVRAGQLSDDLEEIATLNAASDDELLAVWHELGHLLGPLARLAALTLP